MGIKTAKTQQPEPVKLSDDTAELFAEVERAELELAGIDVEISAAELERDQADAERVQAKARGQALPAWRAEERYVAASAEIAKLLERRRDTAGRRNQLAEIAAPIHARARKIAETEALVAALERLRTALPLLEQVVEIVDAAQPDLERAGGQSYGVVPHGLRDIATGWRSPAHRLGEGDAYYLARYHLDVEAARERLARLRAGL